jgi:hypothetical protein
MKKKTTPAGYERTDAWKVSEMRRQEVTEATGMQHPCIKDQSAQGTMFTEDHIQQDGMSLLLEAWGGLPFYKELPTKISPETLTRKSTAIGETNRSNGECGAFITHSSIRIHRVEKVRP